MALACFTSVFDLTFMRKNSIYGQYTTQEYINDSSQCVNYKIMHWSKTRTYKYLPLQIFLI